MADINNPALDTLVAQVTPELVLAQLRILHLSPGYELRHAEDKAVDASKLRRVQIHELRALAQVTAAGTFRPLRSAPTLQQGWFAIANDADQLGLATNLLYPGAVADWYAVLTQQGPVTGYREFSQRQSGMYRITQKLTDLQAGSVIRAVCPPHFCLKRRLWTVASVPPDPAGEKSMVPCLEPCAMLLEFARKAARWEQEEKLTQPLSSGELAALKENLRIALDQSPAAGLREADYDNPDNPRRLQWILERQNQNCFS